MTLILLSIFIILSFMNPGNIQANSENNQEVEDFGIIVDQADRIVELWEKKNKAITVVNAARSKMESELTNEKDTADEQKILEIEKSHFEIIDPLEEELERKETALNNAIKYSSFPGDKKEAIYFAHDVKDKKDMIDRLEKEAKEKAEDKDFAAAGVLTARIKLAKDALKGTIETQYKQALVKALGDQRFRGFGFGVAIGVIIDTGSNDRIDEASIDSDRIVRVDKERDVTANFILESHYFFTPNSRFLGFGPEAGDWGIGPFVAVQPGSDDVIEGAGIGIMLGMKRADLLLKNVQPDLGDSFNFGIGVFVDPDEQILRDDFQENEKAPTNATEVKFKRKAQTGVMVLFSYSF